MCGIMNGLALHSNLIPYGGTFLIFSDYKPSIRLAAMMKQRGSMFLLMTLSVLEKMDQHINL